MKKTHAHSMPNPSDQGSDQGQPSLLLRPGEAAKLLAISPRKLWELTNTGEVPSVRIGRCLRYSRQELWLWVAKQQGIRS